MGERERVEALIREEKEIVAALRSLAGLERGGGGLDFTEEQRQEQLRSRLQEIRSEAREIRSERDRRRRERREAEQRRREEEQRAHEDHRSKTERENSLINAIVNERRSRSFEVGLGGMNVGGQPRGAPVIVELARKVEREISLAFDQKAEETFGYPAKYIRNLGDDEYFGIHLGKSGEIEPGPPAIVTAPVESPTPQPHRDWSGPSVPQIPR